MIARLHMTTDSEAIAESLNSDAYLEYAPEAFHDAASDFGMPDASGASDDQILRFLWAVDGKEIDVDPDFWDRCGSKSERPEFVWDVSPGTEEDWD